MFIVDTNVLLNAINSSARDHEAARGWLENVLGGNEAVGFAWAVVLGFVRVATRTPALPRRLTIEEAFDALSAWREAPAAVAVDPGPRHAALLRELLTATGGAGNLVTDAHLAALALEHDATIASFDRDFARFGGLRLQVPA